MPLKDKEKRKEYMSSWQKTESGLKSTRINKWIYSGIICDDFNKFYDEIYLQTKTCNVCKVILTEDIKKNRCSTTKCLDHNHNITNRENIRYVCCSGCNSRIDRQKQINNTSGHKNISYNSRDNLWTFTKTHNKIKYIRNFKNKQHSLWYKFFILVCLK